MDKDERQAIIDMARNMIRAIGFCEDTEFAENIFSALANCEYIPDVEE